MAVGSTVIGKGVFYSQIMRVDGQGLATAMLLPPRYRGQEEALATCYGLTGVQDAGLRAAMRWLKETLGLAAEPAAKRA